MELYSPYRFGDLGLPQLVNLGDPAPYPPGRRVGLQ